MTEKDDGRGEVSFKDSQTMEYEKEGIRFRLEIDRLEMFLLSSSERAYLMGSMSAFADLTAGVIENRDALIQADVSANQYLSAIKTILERANAPLSGFFVSGTNCRVTLEEGEMTQKGQDGIVYESPELIFKMELAGLGSLPPEELFMVMDSAKSFSHLVAGMVANKEEVRIVESLSIPLGRFFNEINRVRLEFERVYEEIGISLN